MGKGKRKYWQKPMVVTVILILLMAAASLIVVKQINSYEERKCFDRLREETKELLRDIETNIKNDTENLELLARVVSEYEDLDSEALWEILDSYTDSGMISGLELLLPDNSVLTESGRRIDAEGILSFQEEKSLGVHMSDREEDLNEKGRYIVRNCVPVIQDGETKAILCGIIDLQEFPEKMKLEPYGGDAALYLIDGNTGEFLADTWHKELGNIWEMGERRLAEGYRHDQLKNDLTGGRNGYVVFVSETTGEYLYFYFAPMEINQWRAALSVPENIVFASADSIRNLLNIFVCFEILCFVVYFLWMLRNSLRAADEKQRQLDTVNYIYDVEKLLFNAHERKENIGKALEKIGYIISAEAVGFFMRGDTEGGSSFVWSRRGNKGPEIKEEIFEALWEYFRTRNCRFDAFTAEKLKSSLPGADLGGIKNMIAVPVEEMDGTIRGILAGFNLSDSHISSAALKSVCFSFNMFCNNIWSYNAMKEKGEKDILSGLYNRNKYESDLPVFPKLYHKSLACIYIDVNGLHELNNTRGHEAGDEMLKAVSEQIRGKFGERYAYRVGGDEFIVFALDAEEDEVNEKTREIVRELEKSRIYVSVGAHWESGDFSMDILIKNAEKKMYNAKREFYSKEANDRRMRI